jgi:hypothetical protein
MEPSWSTSDPMEIICQSSTSLGPLMKSIRTLDEKDAESPGPLKQHAPSLLKQQPWVVEKQQPSVSLKQHPPRLLKQQPPVVLQQQPGALSYSPQRSVEAPGDIGGSRV